MLHPLPGVTVGCRAGTMWSSEELEWAGVPLTPLSPQQNPFAGLVSHLQASWLSGKPWPMEYMAQLEALGHFLDDKKQQILEATASDLGKVKGDRNRRTWWLEELRGSHSPAEGALSSSRWVL